MKMKVVDQLHISALGSDTMGKGQEFEVSDAHGAELEKKGVAVRVADAAGGGKSAAKAETAEKAEKAPLNKADFAAPANKAEPHKRGDK